MLGVLFQQALKNARRVGDLGKDHPTRLLCSDSLGDFADTAIPKNLDLLNTIDTSVAHLAGAGQSVASPAPAILASLPASTGGRLAGVD